jgi:hypothetical protein
MKMKIKMKRGGRREGEGFLPQRRRGRGGMVAAASFAKATKAKERGPTELPKAVRELQNAGGAG